LAIADEERNQLTLPLGQSTIKNQQSTTNHQSTIAQSQML
jgi:hypothetical protein